AAAIITRGRADAMIAGTTGTRLHPVKTMHAKMWDQLADEPAEFERRCRPFDLDRCGQVVGEGACSFLLEDESHARARGAEILGVLLGAGSSCVQRSSGTPDCGQALVNAMHVALANADLQPSDIGHVNANGLSTTEGDKVEARALQEVFGDDGPPVTALKSYLGNAGSGCGTLELAGSLLGLKHGVVPATLNYDTPDPECPIHVVHGQPAATTNKVVLSINVTRCGQASALIAGAA
ncbi:MAG: beta-ketoacyl synthase N-terminal-like domain-containing protein, partial [Planctomycetaceae bacterium]